MKNKKSIILLVSLIVTSIFIILRLFFGIIHNSYIINIFLIISYLLIFILNLLNLIKKDSINLIFNVIHIMFLMISLILILLLSFNICLSWFLGKQVTINTYSKPNNNKEALMNIYYADIEPMMPPIELVYEKELFLGFKCRVVLKTNSDNLNTYDLETEYNNLEKLNDKGFCNYKIKNSIIEFIYQ